MKKILFFGIIVILSFSLTDCIFNYEVMTSVEGEGNIILSPEKEEYRKGSELMLTAEPSEGYKFNRWLGDLPENIDKNQKTITFNVEDETSIVANFERKEYEVEFKNHLGTVKIETVMHGENANQPDIPTREGYNFIGWSQDYNNITNNLVIHAEFEKKKHEITFKDHNGTIKTETVEHGNSASAPKNPRRKAHDFIGWDKSFDNVKENMIVNAEFEPNLSVLYEKSLEIINRESEYFGWMWTVAWPTATYKGYYKPDGNDLKVYDSTFSIDLVTYGESFWGNELWMEQEYVFDLDSFEVLSSEVSDHNGAIPPGAVFEGGGTILERVMEEE